MVKLVNDDVVELVAPELVESEAEGLNAGKDDASRGVFLRAVEQAEAGLRMDPAEYIPALGEDLLAVRDEQHPTEARPRRVERGEPGLAEPRRQCDQSSSVSGEPGLFQC